MRTVNTYRGVTGQPHLPYRKIGDDDGLCVCCRSKPDFGTLAFKSAQVPVNEPTLETQRKATVVSAAQVLTSILASIAGIDLAGQYANWQHRRAERDLAAGRPASLPASIRMTDGGRWRHGIVDISSGRVAWTPRTPWGRSLTSRWCRVRHSAGARRPPSVAASTGCGCRLMRGRRARVRTRDDAERRQVPVLGSPRGLTAGRVPLEPSMKSSRQWADDHSD